MHTDALTGPLSIGVETTRVYHKVTWRIVPLLFLCYLTAFLDRINIGFAQAAIREDLGLSGSAFSFGASIFFVSYLIFEIPSNIYLDRIGARKTLARIMITWGLVSAATMFVRTPMEFYIVRFLLGVAEAGFFPGVVLYLTYWYPPRRRAQIVAMLMLPIAFAGLLGAPVSGFIMESMNGVNNWHGWQWMFLLEATPSILLGLVVLEYLDDKPRDAARWLAPDEIAYIEADLANNATEGDEKATWRTILSDWRVYIILFAYCAMNASVIGIGIWMPQIIHEASLVKSTLYLGLLTAIPYVFGGGAMLIVAVISDRFGQRRRFCAAMFTLAALGFWFAGMFVNNLLLLLAAFAFVEIGTLSSYPVFWALVSHYFRKREAAVGLAFVSSIGQIGAFASPLIINASRTFTGAAGAGFDILGGVLMISAVAVLLAFRSRA